MSWLWLLGITALWVLGSPTFWWVVIIAGSSYYAGKRRQR